MNPDTLLVVKEGERKTAKEILTDLSADLCLTETDIQYILSRTPEIRSDLYSENLLGSVALFIRCSKSKVPPMSFKLLSKIVCSKGYNTITEYSIIRGVRRLRKRKIYPPYCPVRITDLLITYAPFIKRILQIKDEVTIIAKTKKILEITEESGVVRGKSPLGKIASALYIALILSGEHRSQSEVAMLMGVSETTIRTIYQEMSELLYIPELLE